MSAGRSRRAGAETSWPSRSTAELTSDRAAQVFKDPYLFDFLGTADPRRERDVEQALIDHIQRFLIELGSGFAFVGRQVLLEVGDQELRNRLVVEYALRDLRKPIGVAKWKAKIVKTLPRRLRGILPAVQEIEAELGGAGDGQDADKGR